MGLLLLLTSGISQAQTQFYVSPGATGNGTSPTNAFGTIAQAQTAVRAVNASMTGDITVYLLGGNYNQTSTLSYVASDSGMNSHNIIYTAYQGQVPVISGGKQITGWTLHDGAKNIWQASVSGMGVQDRQLYVNGLRAARASEAMLTGNTITRTSTGYTITYSTAPPSSTLMQNWGNPSDIEFVYTGNGATTGLVNAWAESRCEVSSISGTSTSTTVTMKNPTWGDLTGTQYGGPVKNPSRVENAYELLSQPGQWYLSKNASANTTANTLYYIPRSGESMAAATVVAPVLETLLSVQGTSGSPVHNVEFQGIAFAYSTWLMENWSLPANNGFVDGQATFCFAVTPGNIVLGNATNIQFQGDIFAHLGATGVQLTNGAQNDSFVGSIFTDISGNAIQDGDITNSSLTGNQQVTGNVFSNNYIHDNAVEFHGGVGIFAGYVENTTVTHNEVFNCPYSGMSIGWGDDTDDAYSMTNNAVNYNYVHEAMQLLNDGGAIYTRGVQPNSTINYNYLTDSPSSGSPGGLYPDIGTSGGSASTRIEISNNVLTKVYDWIFIWTNAVQHLYIHDNFTDTSNINESNGFPGGNKGNDTASTANGASPLNPLITDDNLPTAAQAIVNNAGIQSNWTYIKSTNVAAFSQPATVATPTISPNGGSYQSATSVTLADATSGASIYYTLDGSTPTTGSSLYSSPLTLTNNVTLKAIAAETGYTTSAVASASFSISPWTSGDLGPVGIAGTSSVNSGTGLITVSGSGSDIWNTADQCQYICQPATGNFQMIARVVTAPAFTSGSGMVSSKAKGGLMIRQSTAANDAQVTFAMNPSNGVGMSFQVRAAAGGNSSEIQQTSGTTVPNWLMVVRNGNVFSAYYSADGVAWTAAGSTTVTMTANVVAGLAITSNNNSQLDTATFDHVSVGSPLASADVGAVGLAGTSSSNPATGVYTVTGAGADIWNGTDAFQYDYQNISGNCQLVARVATACTVTSGGGAVSSYAKAGIMIRETTAANSTYVLAFVYPSLGLCLQERTTTGANSTQTTQVSGVVAPQWIKLVRSGNLFTGYYSADGSTWNSAGSTTITMASNVAVGLAVTAHTTSQLDTATFDDVTCTPEP